MTALHPIFTDIFAAHFPAPAEPESAYDHRPRQCFTCESYDLVQCAQPRCPVHACKDCLTECMCCRGAFLCEEHVTQVDLCGDGVMYPVCGACLKEGM